MIFNKSSYLLLGFGYYYLAFSSGGVTETHICGSILGISSGAWQCGFAMGNISILVFCLLDYYSISFKVNNGKADVISVKLNEKNYKTWFFYLKNFMGEKKDVRQPRWD